MDWIEISGKQGFLCVYTPEFSVAETSFSLLHCCEMLTIQVPSSVLQVHGEVQLKMVRGGTVCLPHFTDNQIFLIRQGNEHLGSSLFFSSTMHMTWEMVVLLFFMAGWEMQWYLWE